MALRVDMLRAYLRQTLDGSTSHAELTGFVQLARTLVSAYLTTIRTSAAILCENHGISITDLAYDCVAELFGRDNKGSFVLLEGFVGALHRSLEETPDHELIAAFRALLSRFADMELGRLYAEADPAGARIYRNIRECIKRGGPLQLSRDFRGWVITPATGPDLNHLPSCNVDRLKSEFHARLEGVRQTPQLLGILHRVLVSLTEFRRSIPLADVVHLFKGLYQGEQRLEFEEQEAQSLEGLRPFEIDQLRTQVEQVLKEKILVSYVAHGKVDRKQGEAMYLAFCDLLGDWCSGDGADFSMFEYLKRYLPIDERSYKDGLRVKMEYLMKIAREEFASRLMGDL
jgi:hypothetical protein